MDITGRPILKDVGLWLKRELGGRAALGCTAQCHAALVQPAQASSLAADLFRFASPCFVMPAALPPLVRAYAGKMKAYFKDCDIKYIEPTTMIRREACSLFPSQAAE